MTYPHHQMAIEPVKGRKRTSDPCHSKIGLGKGRKPTSNPCHSKTDPVEGMKYTSNPCCAKINSARGMKPTSDPWPCKQFVFVSIGCLSMHKQTYCRHKTPPIQHLAQTTCLSETIFVYAKDHAVQNRIQIPLTPTPPPQNPMFSRFAVLYQNAHVRNTSKRAGA